jgi:D-3-phosphoglycerate dehydrogenase
VIRRARILVTESADFSPAAATMLRGAGELVLANLDRAGLLRVAGEADVLWVRLRHRIDAEVLAAARSLRVLATPTTGLTHVDVEEAARRGVHVLSLRGETDFLRDVRATAEHTIALMLALLRHLPAATQHTTLGGWTRDRFRGHELYGHTVGLIGYGRLGRIVARYLTAFDARVLVADPHVDPATVDAGVTLVPLDELLRDADIVSLHASHTPETHGMLGAAHFATMKPGAYFVNTARGELVDELALEAALRAGHLGGAALDVLVEEHATGMGGHRLVRLARERPDVIITPHIGGCTAESMEKTELFMAERLLAMLGAYDENGPPARATSADVARARH